VAVRVPLYLGRMASSLACGLALLINEIANLRIYTDDALPNRVIHCNILNYEA